MYYRPVDCGGYVDDQVPLILCCGWPNDLYAFLSALEGNGAYNVLVLSSNDAPSWGRWNRDLRSFGRRCVWMHGSPLSLEDLKNAGALLAYGIVIFSQAHAFVAPGEPPLSTSADHQTVLVRQQLFALFARVDEYLRTSGESPVLGAASEEESEAQVPVLKMPWVVTELQERDSVEYLSSSQDVFLISALRSIATRKEIGQIVPKNASERGEDANWLREGGRATDTNGGEAALKFQFNRSALDSSPYVVQSEYRSGRVYLREMGYALIGFGLPVSRHSMDSNLIEHAVDGSCSPVCEIVSKVELKHQRLQRYRLKSPVQLINIPKMFHNVPFKEAFSYFVKFENKLPIGVLRTLIPADDPDNHASSGGPSEIVISCPSPVFQLIRSDRLYVILPTPKYVLGMLLTDNPH
ncbi:hypothetical protein GNI_027850 [Gregarina niphandrodes]|uniref:RCK N-terminal domain-containing protein n=1 Tax=Gregarina niphandrodes TaxID=110365 RepID=A0A023BBD2_GRENI|nr:hypothetical protein GNI_027850 [Gregarina niphandrodes]EZG79243.1 hypothetical protein GNI_027850 [Gregarina niphandrodes]|eukprot:XP_011129090.1 hypothetical protein GNI_027850 [Gregarina niphandrodes]